MASTSASSSSMTSTSASSSSSVGASGTCPGESVIIDLGATPITLQGDTTGASDKFVDDQSGLPGSDCLGGSYAGPDRVYAVTPSASGTLTATLTATYAAPYIHVRTACPGIPSDEVACQWSDSEPNTVTLAVTSGTTYYVVADGWGGGDVGGSFTLALSLL